MGRLLLSLLLLLSLAGSVAPARAPGLVAPRSLPVNGPGEQPEVTLLGGIRLPRSAKSGAEAGASSSEPGGAGTGGAVAARAARDGSAPAYTGPDPAELRAAPALQVRTRRATRANTGRGNFFLMVEEFGPGQALRYAGSREGWVLVGTPNGSFGWVPGADVELTDPAAPGVTYRIQPGRWELSAPDGRRLEVTRAGGGALRLVYEGAPVGSAVARPDRDSLAVIHAAPVPGPKMALPVGDGGVWQISLSEAGVLVDLEQAPLHRTVADGAGRIELELFAGLAGVTAAPDGWLFQIRGEARPLLRERDRFLQVEFPTAALAPEFAGVPEGVRVSPDPGGAGPAGTARAEEARPSGLTVTLPMQPGPRAFYRLAPGQLELRFLRPGLSGKRIYLDPGHGGEETGAVGPAGLIEKDLNLGVALRLRTLLEAAGAQVVMARSTDQRSLPPERRAVLRTYSERTRADLEHRVADANQAQVDLFLSIHGNGGAAGQRGTETYWTPANLNGEGSLRLAELVQAELLKALGLPDRGVRQRAFLVVRYSDAPAVLAELGFVTDPAEERLLRSELGQKLAAEALFSAVQQFFADSAP